MLATDSKATAAATHKSTLCLQPQRVKYSQPLATESYGRRIHTHDGCIEKLFACLCNESGLTYWQISLKSICLFISFVKIYVQPSLALHSLSLS